MLESVNMNLMNEFVLTDTRKKCDYRSDNNLFLCKIEQTIEMNLSDRTFNHNSFASKMEVSRSTLQRKLFLLTGLTPCKLITSLRIKLAMQLLANDIYNVTEIAYKVGFNDPKYFSRCFKNQSGLNPKEFQKSVQMEEVKINNSNKEKTFFVKAVNQIEKKIKEPNYCINQFATDLCVSKSNLYRKVKGSTGQSPSELIRSVKLNYSTKLFTTDNNIQDIAWAVGFYDSKYFSRCFKKEHGLTPTQYKTLISRQNSQ